MQPSFSGCIRKSRWNQIESLHTAQRLAMGKEEHLLVDATTLVVMGDELLITAWMKKKEEVDDH